MMKTLEYHTRDKSEWGAGPWQGEPDKIQFPDEETGLPCLIVRGPSGALCGYVGVSGDHPAYGKHYDHEALLGIAVHWGLSFSDKCQEAGKEHGICHIPGKNESDDVWWLGFDCAHYGDFCPKMDRGPSSGAYRDVAFVKTECASLAKQLAEMTP